MDDIVKGITALMPLLLAIVAGFVAIYAKVDGVHKQINSRMDEFVASTRALAHAEGVTEERERTTAAGAQRAEGVAEGLAQAAPLPVIDTHNDAPNS
jgi:hypothetical protein